ncbi:MAG: GyrI-like domain-containing protein [Mariprofundaceae bacterium]
MPENQEPPLSNKALAAVLAVLVLALFGGVGVAAYIGVFTDVIPGRITAPAYRIAYLNHTGPYNKIEPIIEQVAKILEGADIKADAPFALFFDESSTPGEKKRSKIGYIIGKNVYVPGPLEAEIIPGQEVVRATFDGSPMLGSYKAYSEMKSWATYNGYNLSLPALEIYHPEGWVEYQLPIHKGQH